MLEVADIWRLHGPAYRAQFGKRMLPSHRRAMQDIEQCRTTALGGQLYFCQQCQSERYSYHSCKNRHCPKCGNDQARRWLIEQQQLLLPVPYFLCTFTLPAQLRPLARSNQRLLYNLLFRCAAQALLKLTQDPRFVGGQPAIVGVLQTWTRDLRYHPHVHFIVSGGGLTADGRWRAARAGFLVHEKPLAIIFRAKLRDALKQAGLYHQVQRRVWQLDWVVDCKPVGSGVPAFKYLAPYIFRVALSNNRLVSLTAGQVTFKYKESATHRINSCTLPAQEFIRRFLLHVLPPRFVKVRYYGLLSPSKRHLLARARQLLAPACAPAHTQSTAGKAAPGTVSLDSQALTHNPQSAIRNSLACPNCGGALVLKQTLRPLRARAP